MREKSEMQSHLAANMCKLEQSVPSRSVESDPENVLNPRSPGRRTRWLLPEELETPNRPTSSGLQSPVGVPVRLRPSPQTQEYSQPCPGCIPPAQWGDLHARDSDEECEVFGEVPLGQDLDLSDNPLDGTAVTQRRDKGKWRTMTKFEIRNNMAYASQMQFEVLRRALWVQQAQPQTVFNWQFWERAAQDPKMTAYLTHGVKAKMCETTPFVTRAQLEQACDSL